MSVQTVELNKFSINAIMNMRKLYKFHDIDACYEYHNSEHISFMLNYLLFSEYRNTIPKANLDLLILAIVYHDSVYFPGESTNEMDSADNFEAVFLDSFIEEYGETEGEANINYVKGLIKSTKIGATQDEIGAKVLHDLDYGGFSLSRKQFLKNSRNISKEFLQNKTSMDFHSKEFRKYVNGRLEFLKKLYNSPKIYYFDHTFLDEIAKEIILFEIDILENFIF